jgi:hypothetical protein
MMLNIDIQFVVAYTQLFSYRSQREHYQKKRFKYTTNYLTSRFRDDRTVFSVIG